MQLEVLRVTLEWMRAGLSGDGVRGRKLWALCLTRRSFQDRNIQTPVEYFSRGPQKTDWSPSTFQGCESGLLDMLAEP